ncbi:MAG: DUF4013 domain-containing protein [Syntrophomonadaceae bacterium]|nr:DUF4013 domain-containing protein [Syntrophomonadaceae bacterium]
MNIYWQNMLIYPFSDKNWPFKILIGTVLTIIPVINIVTLGYYLACMRRGIMCRYDLPDWINWRQFLQEGLWVLLIVIFYLLLPLAGFIILGNIPFLGGFFSSLLLLCVSALIPIALANFSLSRRLEDAFKFGDLIRHIIRIQPYYMIIYLLSVFLLSILFIFTIIVPVLIVLSGALFFYICAVISYLFGFLYYRG